MKNKSHKDLLHMVAAGLLTAGLVPVIYQGFKSLVGADIWEKKDLPDIFDEEMIFGEDDD